VTTRILLLGSSGQLGWELNRTLTTLGDLSAVDYPQIDMANPDSIRGVLNAFQPNIVVNATAYTNVDKAEREQDLARSINATGVEILAQQTNQMNAALIHYSTDFVFDGKKGTPYTEVDKPAPLGIYGETKLAGEHAVEGADGAYLIFRTSWVYSLRRPCFVTKVLQWAREQEIMRIVDDQVSSPTWARSLAEATAQLIAQGRKEPVEYIQEKKGLFHLASKGSCSRYEWAQAILEHDPRKAEQVVVKVLPAKSEDFLTLAERPKHSVLDIQLLTETFNLSPPDWYENLQQLFY
jgi:dTDP-4-dehydrorhamnose reductase